MFGEDFLHSRADGFVGNGDFALFKSVMILV